MKTIGLIGAGHIGSQLARLAVKNGYDVVVSNSRGPETLADLVGELGPHARAADPRKPPGRRHRRRHDSAEEPARRSGRAARRQDRHRHAQLLPAARRPHRRSRPREDDDVGVGAGAFAGVESGEGVQPHLRGRADDAWPAGRLAEPPRARDCGQRSCGEQAVTALLDQFGFDTVDMGPLSESWRIQRDTPGYGPRRTADELRKDLATAKRPPAR